MTGVHMPRWSDEAVAELRQGVADGLSAGEVSKRTGLSRAAVSGKAARMGLKFKGDAGSFAAKVREGIEAPKRPLKAPPVTATVGQSLNSFNIKDRRQTVAPSATGLKDEPPGLCTIHTLKTNSCRWPIGDTFCGLDQERGSYCKDHASRAYVTQEPRKPKATPFNGRRFA